jgi:hypothetical protein
MTVYKLATTLPVLLATSDAPLAVVAPLAAVKFRDDFLV